MIAEQLKKSILQAAIQGKLTQQLPEDGNARDLLAEIQKEKAQLIREGKIKKEKPLPEITEEEKPFDIPENWRWIRLGDIADYKKGPFGSSLTKGMFVSDGENSIKVYEQKNAIQKDETLGEYYIPDTYYQSTMRGFTVKGGDIIISCAGTIGESYILPSNARVGIINQALMRVRVFNGVDKVYFIKVFDYAIKTKDAKGKGSAIKNIPPFEILKNIPVPFPPISEQNRIVQRLNELLPQIDKLKSDEFRLDVLQRGFPKRLRASVLQCAVEGKLTEQLPSDGDAHDLLAEIQKEKARLIREGKIKKEKPSPEITEDEKPFDIPDNWCWVRLGTILQKLTDGTHVTPKYTQTGVPFLSVKDVSNGQISFDNTKFISLQEHRELYKRCNPQIGDILLTKVGTTGIPVLIETEIEFSLFVSVALLKFSQDLLCGKFLVYLLQSPLVGVQCEENTKGVGNKNWVIRDISNTLIALPPLAEQNRIVQRLNELLPEIDKLERLIQVQNN